MYRSHMTVLSARCVEAVGFKAVFQTGAGIRDAELGMPDIGLATASEIINNARDIWRIQSISRLLWMRMMALGDAVGLSHHTGVNQGWSCRNVH